MLLDRNSLAQVADVNTYLYTYRFYSLHQRKETNMFTTIQIFVNADICSKPVTLILSAQSANKQHKQQLSGW